MLAGLNRDFSNFENKTKEDIVNSFNEVVLKFYSTVAEPLFTYRELKEGKEPNIAELNSSFIAAQQDLEIIYTEMASIRQKLASNFNALTAATSRIKSGIAQASSDLLDYSIQNSNRFQPTFADNFIDLSKIENDDTAFSKDKVFIDTQGARVVLPLDGEAEALKIKRISIASDSIGTSGNNQELSAVARDNLELLIDGNMDTWFEFEQVSKREIITPTILNLKIELNEEKIFNMLEVATLAMPNGTYPAISSIRGSVDNNTYFDLMPFFLGQTDKDAAGNKIIALHPDDNNPNESDMLYFSPKKVKYLTIKFMEDASYLIRTPSGLKNRTAIALKEIKLKAQKFKQEGSLISTNFISEKEISKIALTAEETFPPNFDTTIKYFISVDEGKNWDEIGNTKKINTDIPEVLNYNIDFLEGSKDTNIPVKSIKLKADFLLEKNSDDTTINSSFRNVKTSEFVSISPGSKSLIIKEKPIGSLNIYQLNFGSVGNGSFYRIPMSNILELDDKIIVELPLEVFSSEHIGKDKEVIYVGNQIWSRVDSLNASLPTDQVYEFDYINNMIIFHRLSGGVRQGKNPGTNILFRIKRENPLFNNFGEKFHVETKFSHDGIKEKISLYKIKEDILQKDIRLKNLSRTHILNLSEIQHINILKDINNKLEVEREFKNGVAELLTSGEFSIDKNKGVIYTFDEVSNDEEIVISVSYKKKEDINFDIVDGIIQVKASDYLTESKTFSFNITSPLYVLDLGIKNIAKGTLQFNDTVSALGTEVKINEMQTAFQSDIENPYSIDYINGFLYSKAPLVGKISGLLAAADCFIEYNISRKLPQSVLAIMKDSKEIVLSDNYVLDYFAERQTQRESPLFKIEYSYAEDIKESSNELVKYVTPFLNNYKIITTPKEVLT
ncbi:MAG: hypothetical protein PHY47_00275 [Lachnospiraceae bacterium]|nr:hypothetical protein [Lachnospiraceae bacterium]